MKLEFTNLDQVADAYEDGKISTSTLFKVLSVTEPSLITFDTDSETMESESYKRNVLREFRMYIQCKKTPGQERPLFITGNDSFSIDIYTPGIEASENTKKENK